MEFYHSVFGGDLSLGTFGELHASEDPAEQDKIKHGMLTSPLGSCSWVQTLRTARVTTTATIFGVIER